MQARPKSQAYRDSHQGARAVCELNQDHVKATLGARLTETLRINGLTQVAAAKPLGVDQPKTSRLIRRQLADFSTPRLLRFLALLGQDTEIVVRTPVMPTQAGAGQLRVATNGGVAL